MKSPIVELIKFFFDDFVSPEFEVRVSNYCFFEEDTYGFLNNVFK